MKIIPSLLLILSTSIAAWGQMIDNTASYRTLAVKKYFRIHYENDFFSKTDIYYTQGINIEFVHPSLIRFPLTKLLAHGKDTKYGISIEHLGFTPTSITHSEILTNDRPFAACLFLKAFSILNDSAKGSRIVTSLSTGIIGPGAGGKEMQQTIHRWVHNTAPLGWSNQIRNDVIINYQFDYERKIIPYAKYLMISGKVGIRTGTLSDKVYASAIIMGGLVDNPFQYFTKQKRRFQLYAFAEPQLNVIGYDASLEGGFFNKTSPYTITANNVTRLVFSYNAGFVIKSKRFTAEYSQSFLTKEFKTGLVHHYGGIRLGWSIKS